VISDPVHDLVSGHFRLPETGKIIPCPIESIVIEPDLDGSERDLLGSLGFPQSTAIICDRNTHDALGSRIAAAVPAARLIVLTKPKADLETADRLADDTRHYDAMVAVGSGSLNDIVKYVSHQRRRPYAVFATAPSMNGYVTSTASLSRGGEKLSLPASPPKGAFFDLSVLADAPRRLIIAGAGDSLCRSTVEVDWHLSHQLLGTAVLETPFTIQRADEARLLENAGKISDGDLAAIEPLVRLLVLGGLGMMIAGSSQPGSQAEHLISHYIDMLHRPHPGSLHGEQVGLATRVIAQLQQFILSLEEAPTLAETAIDGPEMQKRYGKLYPSIESEFRAKALTGRQRDDVNERLVRHWTIMSRDLNARALPLSVLENGLDSAGVAASPSDLGIDPHFYRQAIAQARELRNRFTILDFAADAGLLEPFLDQHLSGS
jgi:glycerol-1-phosphate dehydrogenase [NAD(P)+]